MIQIQKCLSNLFSKCVCFVIRDQIVSTILFIILEIHHPRKKISNLFWFFRIFWVSLSKLNQFLDNSIAKIQLPMAGDFRLHPGQVNLGLKFCHWNLNGINARDRIKIPLIEACNYIFHYDIIALSETIINNSVPDEDIFIKGFSKEIFRSDHPSGDKKSAVCIYFKETLSLKRRKDLKSMQVTVVTGITLSRKKSFLLPFISLLTKAVKSLICFKKTSKTLLII